MTTQIQSVTFHVGTDFLGAEYRVANRVKFDKAVRLTAVSVIPNQSMGGAGPYNLQVAAWSDGGTLLASGAADFATVTAGSTYSASVDVQLAANTWYRIGYVTGIGAVRWLGSATANHTHTSADVTVTVEQGYYSTSGMPTTAGSPNPLELSGGLSYEVDINVAPNAPVLSVPSTVNRNITNRFSLTASDPDTGDSTSKTEWRYRLIGAPSWTTVSKVSPDLFYDFASGTWLAGDYEIQARTYDAAGLVGPYSSSSFFTAADAPDQPTWVDPINGQTISTESYTGTISAPSVDESEWRLVGDNAGTIDETTILHGPVLKTTGDLRSHTFTGLTNGVTVWWQARTKFGGLWSQWAAIRTPVAYTAPPVPTFEQAPDSGTGSLLIEVSNPAPVGDEPAVSYNDVYVTDPGGVEKRKATFIPPNGSWRYMLPPSGFNGTTVGSIRVVAVGVNGTSTTST